MGKYLHTDIITFKLSLASFKTMFLGGKPFEFRKEWPDRPTLAFAFVGRPINSVYGIVEFGSPIYGTPEEIGAVVEADRPENAVYITQYMERKGKQCAIPVLSYKKIEPMKLDAIKAECGYLMPMSYYHLSDHPKVLEFLLEKYADDLKSLGVEVS